MRRPLAITLLLLLVACAIGANADAKKHKRLRLTCDQTTEEIAKTAEQYRTRYNAMGFTIEPAPYGVLVSGGCKNVAPLTRRGRAFMADVHHSGDNDPPFPGETNPNVVEYHWFWDETVARTKKGKLRDTVTNFTCVKDIAGSSAPSGLTEVPC